MLVSRLEGVIAADAIRGFVSGVAGEAWKWNRGLRIHARRQDLSVRVVVAQVVEMATLRANESNRHRIMIGELVLNREIFCLDVRSLEVELTAVEVEALPAVDR